MGDNNVNALADALLNMEKELAEFGNLYQSLDAAKASVLIATEDLKRRADDQLGTAQMQLATLQQTLTSIQNVASESKSLTDSLGKVASEINNVDFPSRLDHIGGVLNSQSVVSQETRDKLVLLNTSVCDSFESLQKELAPIAAEIPRQVAENGKQIEALQNAVTTSATHLLKTLEGVYRNLGVKVDQLVGRVDATNQALGTQATALSTLQAATVRDLESIRKEIDRCAVSVQNGSIATGVAFDWMRKRMVIVQVVVFANFVILGGLAWELLAR